MNTQRIRRAVSFGFKTMFALALMGALIGALVIGFAPSDWHVLWGDSVIDGADAVGAGALAGAITAIVLFAVGCFMIALFGVVLPTILLALLVLVALLLATVAISALGGLALAFSPLLLLGFGCVLLLRALFGRPRSPRANVQT
jgi:hypothetical protein